MSLIWFLSSYPSNAVIDTGLSFDNTLKESLHIVEFAVLYCLCILALLTWRKLTPKTNFIVAMMSVFYGLSDELHQFFIPSRSCTLVDFLKDLTGVLVAWLIIRRAFTVPEGRIKSLLTKGEALLAKESAEEITSDRQHSVRY